MNFNVVNFQKWQKTAMQEISGRGRIPILTGGTGFYIQALLYDIDFTSEKDEDGYSGQIWRQIGKEQGGACPSRYA